MSIYKTITILLALGFLPLMILTAVILVAFGIRGVPVLSAPRCRRCQYDLRAINFMQGSPGVCPECGAELQSPHAILFGKYQRQPRKIILGILLLLLAIGGYITLEYVNWHVSRASMPSPFSLPTQTTAQILAGLPKVVDEPWSWQELQSRLKSGKLSSQEADAALATLIADLNKHPKRPSGSPLSWSDNFIADILQNNLVNQQRMAQLAQAYYRQPCDITMSTTVRTGKPIECLLEGEHAWSLARHKLVWALRSVTTSSTTLIATTRYGEGKAGEFSPDELSGDGNRSPGSVLLKPGLPPGDHELIFTFDCGLLPDSAVYGGFNGHPGQLKKWPAPLCTWQVAVPMKLRVVDKQAPVVTLVEDPARKPFANDSLKIQQLLARQSREGIEIVLKFERKTAPTLPVVGKLVLKLGTQSLPAGIFFASGDSYTPECSFNIPSLPADLKSADLAIIPDPGDAERRIGINQIWGKPIEFKNVPLERFDLK